jgi:hypothetical protein
MMATSVAFFGCELNVLSIELERQGQSHTDRPPRNRL